LDKYVESCAYLHKSIYWQLLWTFLEIFAYLHRYFHWLGWFSFDDKYLLINRRGARALTSESIHSRIFFLLVGDAFPRSFSRRCLSKAFSLGFDFSSQNIFQSLRD